MSRLSKLQRLTKYLAGLKVGTCGCAGSPRIGSISTTVQSDATSQLAHLSGIQILIARPEVHQRGGTDSFREELGTVIFVLEKGLGPDKTKESENEMYSRLLEVADAVVATIADETSSQYCRLVTGLSIASVDVVPEASLFGGWSGYSIELSFE